ncbi:MAG: hypothetical protein GTN97_01835 [Nitrosopumilaceae archaeon]|nr:hypothetical protein [Nitrosopumilaceae archaeon]NIP09891.1 hypothetical protein [Nitrosopumilaceae archaeon]NIS94662.1 hypothetical protein [Nitrosopumilaceae archaeon]
MNYKITIFSIGLICYSLLYGLGYSQGQSYDEFMDWCEPQFGEKCEDLYEEQVIVSEDDYNIVLFFIVIMIALGIIGNYFWSKRKGRSYSEE